MFVSGFFIIESLYQFINKNGGFSDPNSAALKIKIFFDNKKVFRQSKI